MTAQPEFPTDLLRVHGQGLRSLAHGLLHDEHTAEDVVQDTWMAALERPPRSRAGFSGWLRSVARGLALKHRRGEGRRTWREREVARPEAHASVEEGSEKRELLRGVVEAVLALEEPYQSVVIERYYQDLEPRAIAKRRGVPVATVKSQLHRAREKLRVRLDEESGGERRQWASALALVTGWPGGGGGVVEPAQAGDAAAGSTAATGSLAAATAGQGAIAGGIAMEWKIALGCVGAGVLWAGASGVVTPLGLGAPESRVQGGTELSAVALDAAPGVDGSRSAVEQEGTRRAVAPNAVLVSEPPPPYEFVLEGVVVGQNDFPLDGIHVHLGPVDQPLNDAGETDSAGRFRIAWRGHHATMPIALTLRKGGLADFGLRVIDVTAGQTTRLRLATRDTDLRAMYEREKLMHRLQAEADAVDKAPQTEGLKLRRVAVARRLKELSVRLRWSGPDPRIGMDHSGDSARFNWHELEQHRGGDALRLPDALGKYEKVRALEQQEQVRRVELTQRARDQDLLAAMRARDETLPRVPELVVVNGPVRDVVNGLVRDSEGRPVGGATVIAWSDAQRRGAVTEEDGTFSIEGTFGDSVHLRAGGGDFGIAEATLALTGEADARHTWDAFLERGREVRGRIVHAQGEGVEDWIIELATTAGTPWNDTTWSPDGRFALPNVEVPGGMLLAYPRNSQHVLPVLVEHVTTGIDAELALEKDALETGSLMLTLVDESGEPLSNGDVRMWQEATGRGAWVAWRKPEYRIDSVPVGHYRVVAGTFERGWVDLGTVDVPAGEVLDLGAIPLPATGRLVWSVDMTENELAPGGVDTLEWTLVRRGALAEALMGRGTLTSQRSLGLPVGEYSLFIRGEGFNAPASRVTVNAGSETQHETLLTQYGEVELSFDAPTTHALSFRVVENDTGRVVTRHDLSGERGCRFHLPVGSYRIEAETSTARGTSSFDVETPGTTSVKTVLVP